MLNKLNIWRNQIDTLDALRAANARCMNQTEPQRPKHISEARWNGMIKYFFTRGNEIE